MDRFLEHPYLYVDIADWTITTSPTRHSSCWLLASTVPVLQQHPWQACFLVSAGSKRHRPTPDQPWTSLLEARRFIQDIQNGRAASFVPPILVEHLTRLDNIVHSEQAMAEERRRFGDLFERDLPQTGLRGFLEKNSAPFTVPSKPAQELTRVMAWLERRCQTNS